MVAKKDVTNSLEKTDEKKAAEGILHLHFNQYIVSVFCWLLNYDLVHVPGYKNMFMTCRCRQGQHGRGGDL